MVNNILVDITIIIVVGTILGYIFGLLRQPLIAAYIFAGVLIGPHSMKFVQNLGVPTLSYIFEYLTITDLNTIHTLSEIGIAFLLFFIGLEINFVKLKHVSSITTLGGTLQIFITFLFGYFLASFLGFTGVEPIYLALVLAFSSTMIVIKLLSDKKELDTLHGRIVVGILLMQDLVAILAISYLSSLSMFVPSIFVTSFAKAILIGGVAFILSKFVFPTLFKIAAKSQEILFLLSLSVCFSFIGISEFLGFSIAIGAFIAGVVLGNLKYNVEIISRVRSLKDFFATIFFVSLGLELSILGILHMWKIIFVLTVFVIVLKPFILQLLTALFGYTKRTGFLTAISLAQVSEFSLIIVAQGMSLGHISQEFFTLTIFLAITTMVATSYFVKYETKIYNSLNTPLRLFDIISPTKPGLEYQSNKKKHDVVLCGYDRVGYSIFKELVKQGKNILAVDFNPEIIKELAEQKVHCIYGDVGDLEIIDRMDLKNTKMVISTVPDLKDNILLIKKAKAAKKKSIVMVTGYNADDALLLYKEGADYVILPHYLGGEHVSQLIDGMKDYHKLIYIKDSHIKELEKRGHFNKKINKKH